MFATCFYMVVFSSLALTILQVVFVAWASRKQQELFEEIGSPAVTFFLDGEFFRFGIFAKQLLSFGLVSRDGLPLKIALLLITMSLLFYVMLTAWLGGTFIFVVEIMH